MAEISTITNASSLILDHPSCVNLGLRILEDGRKLCSITSGGKVSARWTTASECQQCPVASGQSTVPFWIRPSSQTVGPLGTILPCVHRGPPIRVVKCKTCGQKDLGVSVLSCEIHGECTTNRYAAGQKEKCCLTCDSRTEVPGLVQISKLSKGQLSPGNNEPPLSPLSYLPGPITRHLIYHVWPVRGKGVWQWNLDQILKRIDLFNGRRLIGVVTDDSTDPPEAVMDYLAGHNFESIVLPNDPKLGEVVTFLPMLSRLRSVDRNEVIFYAHAKGMKTSHPPITSPPAIVHRWAEAMYELCLDDWPRVETALVGHGFAGNFMRNFGPNNLNYSGTFFWLRSAHVFSRKWQDIRRRYGGVEFWPSNVFRNRRDRACLFGDNCGNLYDPRYWESTIEPRLQAWREKRIPAALPPSEPAAIEVVTQPRHLIFHLFPRAGCDWRSNCMDTFKYRSVFTGRVIVHVVTGNNCDPAEEVIGWLQQFQPLEIHVVENNPAAGINTTFADQIRMIKDESGIVFKSHTKGISHVGEKQKTHTFDMTGWRRNLINYCLHDIAKVERAFGQGYRTFVGFRTTTQHGASIVNKSETRWPGWHCPGAILWFDPTYIPDSFFTLPQHHYINEEFPCILGPAETSFCCTRNDEDFKIERPFRQPQPPPILRRPVSELKNKHAGADVWVIVAGPSMDHVDPAFFANKITVGVNQVYRKFPCTYLVRKDAVLSEEAFQSGIPLVIAEHDGGGFINPKNSVSGPAWYFDHPDLDEGRILSPDDQSALDIIGTDKLIVSHSTITTGIHFAAYLGAANIIVCGHDGGSLDGRIVYTGYHEPEMDEWWDQWYRNWVNMIMLQTRQVRERLQRVYGCRIYSMNPFLGFGLEGHEFKA